MLVTTDAALALLVTATTVEVSAAEDWKMAGLAKAAPTKAAITANDECILKVLISDRKCRFCMRV